jgi:hypothetical protein
VHLPELAFLGSGNRCFGRLLRALVYFGERKMTEVEFYLAVELNE